MSSNTLVAFCVGCLFVLAAITVALSFWERRNFYRNEVVYAPSTPYEKVTERLPPNHGWPPAAEPQD
jgi:predicted membrane-bound spermidine synthase